MLPFEAVEKSGKIVKGERSNMSQNWITTFDEEGQKVEFNKYNPDGSLYYTSTYIYDENGNVIEENRSSGSKEIYEYDDKGNRVGDIQYKADGSLRSTSVYKYDEKGNLTERKVFSSDGRPWISQSQAYTFDEVGNWIEQITINDEVPFLIKERTIEYFD